MTSDHVRDLVSIWDLKLGLWTTEPRFHPPGQHPANYRMREDLRAMEALRERSITAIHELLVIEGAGSERHLRMLAGLAELEESMAWLAEQVAQFEASEAEAKMHAEERYWPEFVRNQIAALPEAGE